jgi:acetolactate synthase-1/2/3 large subunit
MKFSDQIGVWLYDLGYTHYFYVGGGNIMHLTESLSHYLIGIPVVHEVAAGIAAEYFNVTARDGKRALALVTTGPGLTNIITAISGAWLESRELLVLGGQVKVSDLSSKNLRSRGIQEVKGVEIVRSITKHAFQVCKPIGANEFYRLVSETWKPRKGPVFLEIPLDIQAAQVEPTKLGSINKNDEGTFLPVASAAIIVDIVKKYNTYFFSFIVTLKECVLYTHGISLISVVLSMPITTLIATL